MFKQKLVSPSTFLFMIFVFTPLNVQAQLDDPTRPPGHRLALPAGVKTATNKLFLLSAVRISSTRRSAIINDRSVEVGDTVDGAKVIRIYPSEVKLIKKGKAFSVRLVSWSVRKIRVR